MQIHSGDDYFARIVLFQMSNGGILIVFDDEFLHRGDGEEGKHVTAGQGRGKGLFRVDFSGVAEVGGRGGGFDGGAVFEGPGVVSRVVFVAEVGSVTFPVEFRGMSGHGVLMEASGSAGNDLSFFVGHLAFLICEGMSDSQAV